MGRKLDSVMAVYNLARSEYELTLADKVASEIERIDPLILDAARRGMTTCVVRLTKEFELGGKWGSDVCGALVEHYESEGFKVRVPEPTPGVLTLGFFTSWA